MNASVWTANVLGWPAIHLIVGGLAVRLPGDLFAQDTWVSKPRRWEHDGRLYRKLFAVRSWKALLPDGAPWIGGLAKNGLLARDQPQLMRFIAETRRAEIAHWCMLGCLPLFWVWDPRWARLVMTVYGVAANVPCIIAQRYNRAVLLRFVQTRSRVPVR